MISSLWYSARVRAWAAQIALLAGLGLFLWMIVGNTVENLTARGIRTGFDYLWRPARFPISESIVRYDASDSFLWAYVAGLANTLWLSLLSIVFATILGLFVCLARLSHHPVLSYMTGVYVTVLRNVPLIVQLLFWYAIATSVFPAPRAALNPLPGLFLSIRGVYAPALIVEPGGWFFLIASAALFIVALAMGLWSARRARSFGAPILLAALAFWAATNVVLYVALGRPLKLEMPELNGLNFSGGTNLSPEFAAIIVGLTIYTSAFIGEIIRGGIEAIDKGQWEGARALGLSERTVMFKVILPQALRIIVPPMTSQYLSTVKNTTLAVAVGYPELGLVVNTVINQTGQAIESILIMLCVFLSISLSVSLFMNWYNARVALVVR